MSERDTARVLPAGGDARSGEAPDRANVLALVNVSLAYENDKGESIRALEGVDIEVTENEFLVILGPSGCGKSTLLKVMVGLLPPTSGRVLHRGSTVEGTLQDVGMVYQDPLLLPWRNVLENVLLPAPGLSGYRPL